MNALVALVACWVPYDVLIELVVLLVAPSIILFMCSFVQLRRSRPEMERPYRISGGMKGAIALIIPPIAVTLIQAYLALSDETPIFDVPYFKMVCFVVFVGSGGLVHLTHDVHRYGWRGVYHRCTQKTGEYEATSLFAEDGGVSGRASPHAWDRSSGTTFRTMKG
jgi:hypothetical protein